MHSYFAFMHENGWYDTVADRALDEVLEFLAIEDVPHAGLTGGLTGGAFRGVICA